MDWKFGDTTMYPETITTGHFFLYKGNLCVSEEDDEPYFVGENYRDIVEGECVYLGDSALILTLCLERLKSA